MASAEPIVFCTAGARRALVNGTPGPREFLGSPAFLLLTLVLAFYDDWVLEQFNRYMDLKDAARSASTSSPRPAERNPRGPSRAKYFWLQPHITSHWRRHLSGIAFGLTIPFQALEFKWVYTLAWRVSALVWKRTCFKNDDGIGACPGHADFTGGSDGTSWAGAIWATVVQAAWCLTTIAALFVLWAYLTKYTVEIVATHVAYQQILANIQPEAPLDIGNNENKKRPGEAKHAAEVSQAEPKGDGSE